MKTTIIIVIMLIVTVSSVVAKDNKYNYEKRLKYVREMKKQARDKPKVVFNYYYDTAYSHLEKKKSEFDLTDKFLQSYSGCFAGNALSDLEKLSDEELANTSGEEYFRILGLFCFGETKEKSK